MLVLAWGLMIVGRGGWLYSRGIIVSVAVTSMRADLAKEQVACWTKGKIDDRELLEARREPCV